MPIARIQLEDGRIARVEVPEGTTPQQAEQYGHYFSQNHPDMKPAPAPVPVGDGSPDTPAASFMRNLLGPRVARQAGLGLRSLASGAMSTVGLIGDAGASVDKALGAKIDEMPSAFLQRKLTESGMPVPTSTGEKISNFVGNLVGGALFDPAAAAMGAAAAGPKPLYQAPHALPVQTQTIINAQKEGYAVPPSIAGGSKTGQVLEFIGGKNATARTINGKEQNVTDAIARQAAGLPKGAPLTRETLDNAIADTWKQGYEPITQLGQLPTTSGYHAALDKALTEFRGASGSFPKAAKPEVEQLIDSYRVPGFDAADAVRQMRGLREDASTAFQSGDATLGQAHRAVADALENNIEDVLSQGGKYPQPYALGVKIAPNADGTFSASGMRLGEGNPWMASSGLNGATPNEAASKAAQVMQTINGNGPGLMKQFRAARAQLAKQYAVRDSLVEGSGSIDATKMAAQLRQNAPLSGGLKTMGKFANTFPQLAARPTSPASFFTPTEKLIASGAAGALLHGNVGAGAAGAAYPVMSAAARQLLASKIGQQLFAQPAMPGVPFAVAHPYLLRSLPAGVEQSGIFGP